MTAKAVWNGVVLAQSGEFELVEGNVYFPPEALNMQYFKPSASETFCPWKGHASYFTIEVNGETNEDAAWVYRAPYEKAAHIKDHVAFWKGVRVDR